jgi:hypothetical protein
VGTHHDYTIRLKSQRLADLKNETLELAQKLSDARASLDHELAKFAANADAGPEHLGQGSLDLPEAIDFGADAGDTAARHDGRESWHDHDEAAYDDAAYDGAVHDYHAPAPPDRTEGLVNHGRHNSYQPGLSRGGKIAIGTTAAIAAILLAVLAIVLSRGGADWPASVAVVERQAARACQNPDVKAEPSQVDFACAKGSRQILWVFSLLTSNNNPNFADKKTGRVGLEPITPSQGGQVAWSLNLHHPYSPADPVDSLAVAARAINNIIGGATLTGPRGKPVVQPGLESKPVNCQRYTGSAALVTREGFPDVCAKPVTVSGQGALVSDVFQKWIVGATPSDAQDAAVLFQNAKNPGDPQVQAILKRLAGPPQPA